MHDNTRIFEGGLIFDARWPAKGRSGAHLPPVRCLCTYVSLVLCALDLRKRRLRNPEECRPGSRPPRFFLRSSSGRLISLFGYLSRVTRPESRRGSESKGLRCAGYQPSPAKCLRIIGLLGLLRLAGYQSTEHTGPAVTQRSIPSNLHSTAVRSRCGPFNPFRLQVPCTLRAYAAAPSCS